MKILNLYCGIGGNRKAWKLSENDVVFAVEIDPFIAAIYQENFPNDIVIIGDAHDYLLQHFREFDFIWSSPPCPTHSQVRKRLAFKKRPDGSIFEQNKPVYPDMTLYQEIILLDKWFNGKYIIENVIPYYEPLIEAQKIGRHLFWSNVEFDNIKSKPRGNFDNINELALYLGFDMTNWHNVNKLRVLRNCCEPDICEQLLEQVKAVIDNERTNIENM